MREKENAMKDEELAIRERFAEEIYNFIMDNWEKIMGRQGRWKNFNGTCLDLKEDLEKLANDGYIKEKTYDNNLQEKIKSIYDNFKGVY